MAALETGVSTVGVYHDDMVKEHFISDPKKNEKEKFEDNRRTL